jgi:Regulator of Chromosome Condensation (RCC1) repeat protein
VKCWGYNASGQVGDGTYDERHAPVAVSGMSSGIEDVSAGVEHTCALTTEAAVKCWGENTSGELGVGFDPFTSPTPLSVTGLDSGVSAISAGYLHTLALLDDGGLRAWGNGIEGQLGNGIPNVSVGTPQPVSGLFPGDVAQPDGSISNGAGFVGGNIYNTTAVSQTIAVKRARGRSATFTVRIQNDGDATDKILVDGTSPATGFTMIVTRNGTKVTKAFLAGTLGVILGPGRRQDLVVKITVKATTPSGRVDRETVVLTSTNDVTHKDAVRARVTVR